jgi:hypothetical protein
MTNPFYQLPLTWCTLPFIDVLLPLSLNAFSTIVEVIIEKIALTTSVPTAMSLPQVTLPPPALLSNTTFAVVGNMELDFVLLDNVVCAIQEDMWLTTVHLHTFQSNRPPISMGLLPTPDKSSPRGVLIALGVRLYKGGNVTVHIVHHCVYLFSFLQ